MTTWQKDALAYYRWTSPPSFTSMQPQTTINNTKLVLLLAALRMDLGCELATQGREWLPKKPGSLGIVDGMVDVSLRHPIMESGIIGGEAWAYELLGRRVPPPATQFRRVYYSSVQRATTPSTSIASRPWCGMA